MKSSPTPLPDDNPEPRLVGTSITANVEGDPMKPRGGEVGVEDYCIRLLDVPGVKCSLCVTETGRGPVGHYEGVPICDRCLFNGCPGLGAVLELVSIARACAVSLKKAPEFRAGQLEILGDFIESFERVAQSWGPARRAEMLRLGSEEPS